MFDSKQPIFKKYLTSFLIYITYRASKTINCLYIGFSLFKGFFGDM
uniref:Macaca fascicularis brain cDNA clone: QflA-23741, similar to human hypothetical protein LOC253018 (LOC253018), mRNA, RefSeq: NM_181717.1 n=1 Tax=Macaca fascicularis TaxID=9541 RepID=I7GIY8_MACFA|nr:unnamed protein product [Macaca fascicularis]